jgi:hypothetical protein
VNKNKHRNQHYTKEKEAVIKIILCIEWRIEMFHKTPAANKLAILRASCAVRSKIQI